MAAAQWASFATRGILGAHLGAPFLLVDGGDTPIRLARRLWFRPWTLVSFADDSLTKSWPQ